MFWLNKLVGFVLNPMMIGMLFFIAGFCLSGLRKWRFRVSKGRVVLGLNIAGVLWLWFWGSNVTTRLLGARLEKDYPPTMASDLPEADAIVVLGGGTRAGGEGTIYPEMHMGSDRAWHAARLYKAGRAPYVVVTGTGPRDSDRILLLSLGVPDAAILVEHLARNTEEHVTLVSEALKKKYPAKQGNFKILLVTSAWHMRRSLLNFSRSELDIIPAPADHECTLYSSYPLRFVHFFPDAESFLLNSYVFKEYLGYYLYRVKYLFIATTQPPLPRLRRPWWSQLRG